jgi:hypothetical protein
MDLQTKKKFEIGQENTINCSLVVDGDKICLLAFLSFFVCTASGTRVFYRLFSHG